MTTQASTWAVVVNPGTDAEAVASVFAHYDQALSYKRHLTANGQRADVMKALPGGGFTTEF